MRNTTPMMLLLFLAIGLLWPCGALQAGDLEPPGPPASTLVTLQQIYDLAQAGGAGSVAIPKTGQTTCWDAFGSSIPCFGTGQDGEYQAGNSVSPRFTDNGDGSATDNGTGLTWLIDASCFGQQTWNNALSMSNALAEGSCGLTDGSKSGDWRLPNIRELQSLVDMGQFGPALPAGHPFSGVQSNFYFSSTSSLQGLNAMSRAWVVYFHNGWVNNNSAKTGSLYVWPVRGGQ